MTLVKVDRNGSKHFEGYVTCDRCNGRGEYWWGAMTTYSDGHTAPQYSGTCFKCGGAGKVFTTWIERTPEYEAKLAERREARRAKVQAEREAAWAQERAQREAERLQAAQEKAWREAEEAARKAVSQHIGAEGDKLTVAVTVEHIARVEVASFRGYGVDIMKVYTFADANGNKLVWKTCTGFPLEDLPDGTQTVVQEGDAITIRGTVKAHGEYRGEKQTELTRVKKV